MAEHGNSNGDLNSRNRVANSRPVGSTQAECLVRRLKRDAPEIAKALAMYREAMKPKRGRNQHSSDDNVNAAETPKGNSRAYTLSRLQRHASPSNPMPLSFIAMIMSLSSLPLS